MRLSGMRRACPAALAAWLLAVLPALSGEAPAPDTPEALASQARAALQGGNRQSLLRLQARPGALDWTRGEKLEAWSAHLLSLPAALPPREDDSPAVSPLHLLVFSRFHTCQADSDRVHRVARSESGWSIDREIPPSETLGYRIRDHRLQLRFELEANRLIASDELEVERRGDTPVCLLRLSSDLAVEGVKLDGKPAAYAAVPGVIALAAPHESHFRVRMGYGGRVLRPGSDYVKETEVVLTSYWYPHIARLPAKHRVTVTVPKGWTAVGQGELLERRESDAGAVFTFRNDIPVCYFTVDAGPYLITSRTVRGRKLSIYELAKSPGRAERSLNELERCLAFFEETFGPYPYSHYELVETLTPFGGALEAYSFATFGSGTLPGAVVHEAAHSWWGGIVPNTYLNTMWNEWLASYSDDLFQRTMRERSGKPAGGRNLHGAPEFGRGMERAFAVPLARARNTEDPRDGAAGYGKGPLVLAMLEQEIGREAMTRALRRWIETHPRGEAAEWTDLQRAVREVTGTDYGWFFDQWITRAGLPVVLLESAELRVSGSAGEVVITISQRAAPYRLKIPIRIQSGGQVRNETALLEGEKTEVRLPCPVLPARITLDPQGDVLMAGGDPPAGRKDPFSIELTGGATE